MRNELVAITSNYEVQYCVKVMCENVIEVNVEFISLAIDCARALLWNPTASSRTKERRVWTRSTTTLQLRMDHTRGSRVTPNPQGVSPGHAWIASSSASRRYILGTTRLT